MHSPKGPIDNTAKNRICVRNQCNLTIAKIPVFLRAQIDTESL